MSADPGAGLSLLFDAVKGSAIKGADTVAVKMHFGEPGNTAYLKPKFVKPIIECIKKLGAKPFLTDANTLYKGERNDSASHLAAAKKHGYCPETMGCPVVIADGPDGHSVSKIAVNLKHFKEVSLAKSAVDADCLVALSHFKGHDATGFGGAIKNVGMGLGTKAGKAQMHSDVIPSVNLKTCSGDGTCVRWCPTKAITLVNNKATIDLKKCIGCGECVAVCPTGAIAISWAGTPDSLQEKIAEYAFGALKDKKRCALFINFIVEVSPNCDCYSHNDEPIVPDIGILASNDIVAIDQASVDLINSTGGRIKGPDKFRSLYPDIDSSVQLKHAEAIGLGSRQYELVKLG